MGFYDLGIQTEDFEKTVDFAKKLGWDGICLIVKESELETAFLKKKSLGKNPKENLGKEASREIDIALGVLISSKRKYEIKKMARTLRKKVEVIFAMGGNLEVNRAILETPEIDVLCWNTGFDFDYVLAKLAVENNVSIQFSFNDLMYSYKTSRVWILSNLMDVAKLVRKYKSPFILTSGAKSFWDLRSPSELMSFGRVLGFQDREIKESLSDIILIENRKRISGKWVMPGVEIE